MNKIFILFTAFFYLFFPKDISAAQINLELLDSKDYYTLAVRLSGLEKTTCKSKTCYLQGMFTLATGSPHYFGYTFGQLDWFPYTSSPQPDYIKTNFIPIDATPDGSWSGVVRLSLDKQDPDYKGTGQYLIKIKRYTGESSSPATDDLNTLTIDVNDPTPTPTPLVTPTPTTTSTPTPTPTSTPTPTLTPTAAPTPKATLTPSSAPMPTLVQTSDLSTSSNAFDLPLITPEATSSEQVLGVSTYLPLTTPTPSSAQKSSSTSPTTLFGLALLVISFSVLYLRSSRGTI